MRRTTRQARGVLLEALPYIREFRGKTVVIKYGGAAMERADLKEPFALDVILLQFVGINPVIVHGGGPQIGALMKRLGKEPQFVGGMRVTDEETVEIVEMVLVGKINKEIVGLINHHGGRAVGLSGKDGELLRAHKRLHRMPDGDGGRHRPRRRGRGASNAEPIRLLEEHGFIPVIAPVGVGRGGETYNINADIVAGRGGRGARRGEAHPPDRRAGHPRRRQAASSAPCRARTPSASCGAGVIDGGMLPKVESSLRALKGGTAKAHIIDGRVPTRSCSSCSPARASGTEIVL